MLVCCLNKCLMYWCYLIYIYDYYMFDFFSIYITDFCLCDHIIELCFLCYSYELRVSLCLNDLCLYVIYTNEVSFLDIHINDVCFCATRINGICVVRLIHINECSYE